MKHPSVHLASAALALLILTAAPAHHARAQAFDIYAKEYSKGELALLPEWCIDSQDGPYGGPEGGENLNKSPRARRWVGLMGADFWHMHHYCRGLRDMLRLDSAGLSPANRRFLQERAVNEFNYVIQNCSPTMPLLPEVYLRQGDAYVMLQNFVGAKFAFEKSRQLKPDYWPAYDRWIAVLIDLKLYDAARELSAEGLGKVPNQPNLVARVGQIDAAVAKRGGRPTPTTAASR